MNINEYKNIFTNSCICIDSTLVTKLKQYTYINLTLLNLIAKRIDRKCIDCEHNQTLTQEALCTEAPQPPPR